MIILISLLLLSLISSSTQFNARSSHPRRFPTLIMSSAIRHSSFKVQNLKKSVDFYTKCLGMCSSITALYKCNSNKFLLMVEGMTVLADGKSTARLGYDSSPDATAIELIEIEQSLTLNRGNVSFKSFVHHCMMNT
jgi:hypothetical protein